jgi:predicted phage baseplate assembly protein
MPILPPSLDDRRFDDLVDDLVARIPAHTPEWTNPRLGDPGRTLIELFAWLGDALLYRVNLVPERQRLVFLKLLGIGMQPAQPAGGVVALSYAQDKELGACTLKPQGKVTGAVPFETLSETTVLPITGEAYIKTALAADEAARRSDLLYGLSRIHGINGAVKGYQTTPVFAGGRAVPLGVDVFGTSVDRALWIALLAPAAAQAADQPATNDAARSAMGGGDTGLPSLLSIGVVPTQAPPQLFEAVSVPSRVPVTWEITTRGSNANETGYLSLDVEGDTDTTGGLAEPGTLRVRLPDESFIWAPSNDVGVNPGAGVGDAPPRLDDPQRAARLVAWLRLRPQPGQSVEHLSLAWLGLNAVEVDQRVTMGPRVLGVSSGGPDQAFQLPAGSVDATTLQIQVEEPGSGYIAWTQVDDLAAISADPAVAREARAFELDPEAGTLRFGDGVRGRVPDPQMRIRLLSGRFGGGAAGNLPAGSLTDVQAVRIDALPTAALRVWQPLAMAGGADAETLDAAQQRIPGFLRHRDRAVTEDDYRRLALEVPSVDVGRVELLPRFLPRERRFDVPGVVSVMALPDAALAPAPNPRPDRPFVERLHAYLSARTPLATELYVIGCDYVPVGLSVAVTLRDGHATDQVLLNVREALRALLWPLAPGGIDGGGWTLGRAVRSRELEVTVARVDGVDEVSGINLFQRVGDDWQRLSTAAADSAQVLTLQPWQLPELLSVVVAEGPDVPTDLRAVPNPFADANAVAVPVVPELC